MCKVKILGIFSINDDSNILKIFWVVAKKLNPEAFKEKKVIESDAHQIIEKEMQKAQEELNAEIEESLELCDWREFKFFEYNFDLFLFSYIKIILCLKYFL